MGRLHKQYRQHNAVVDVGAHSMRPLTARQTQVQRADIESAPTSVRKMACKFRRGGFHIRPRANNVRPYTTPYIKSHALNHPRHNFRRGLDVLGDAELLDHQHLIPALVGVVAHGAQDNAGASTTLSTALS